MAADCEQTRSLMLELLYGELSPPQRIEVETHVAGCPGCRTELAALESTRALSRQALATDTPPARARANILRAAAAAVPVLRPAPAPSFWSRLKGKWTLPTFATIGAVAVFLLASRIFLEPEKTYERGRQGLKPAAEAPPPPAPAPPPAPTAAVAASNAAPEPAADVPAHLAAPPRPRKRQAPAPAASGRGASAQSQPALDNLLEAPRAAKPAKKSIADEPLEGFAGGGSARESAGAPAYEKAEAPPPPAAAPATRAAAPAPAVAASRHETLLARADRLFAEQRWVEAAAAYRDLLRTDPDNAAAPRWRQRLAACEAAAKSEQ